MKRRFTFADWLFLGLACDVIVVQTEAAVFLNIVLTVFNQRFIESSI